MNAVGASWSAASRNAEQSEFAADVIAGLAAGAKTLPCRWFYDARGSELFEEITRLRDYYPTRCEIEILERRSKEILERTPPGAALVEFGSGSSRKTELLLAASHNIALYVPIDVSAAALDEAGRRLARRFPSLRIVQIVSDFSAGLSLPDEVAQSPRLGFFPGSTIGNFDPREAARLLTAFGSTLGRAARLLVGVDLRKPLDILLPAYNDNDGITAAFNLNLLTRINAELDGDFDIEGFSHEAIWNEQESRIEMHLISRRRQTVTICGRSFSFGSGETIHTENSYKHTIAGFQDLAAKAGWTPLSVWTDAAGLFSLHELFWRA